MVVLTINNNNQGRIEGPLEECQKLYKAMSINHPDAFFLRKSMPKGWDGKVHFIRENLNFQVGLLEIIGDTCDKLGITWDVCDFREEIPKPLKVSKRGDIKLRDYQLESVKALVTNKVRGVLWPRGTIKVATNGGKTFISGFIYLNYKLPTIFLMNSKELFTQALKELPAVIGEELGQISSDKIVWRDFMVCMVKSTQNRMKKDPAVFKAISQYKVLIVDECDLTDNKTNKDVIKSLYNTIVRVGLSGTVNLEIRSKKHEIKNLNIAGFFGKMLYDISNRTLIDKGVSSDVTVTMIKGNDTALQSANWEEEYEEGIIKNKDRNKRIVLRSKFHYNEGRKIQLIVTQRHQHIMKLYKLFQSAVAHEILPSNIVIDWVHHDRPDRMEVVERFEKGEINILIGSMILTRGKNFPKMNFMLNAGGGKSPENTLQLLGRAFRGCKHYEDFMDGGKYLSAHSRKRVLWYKREKIKFKPYKP